MTAAAPRAAVAPDSTAGVQHAVEDAAARGEPLRIVCGGRWLDAGRPVHASCALSLAALVGVVDYVPGDLTLTARAATPLREIARLTSEERQCLALDPFGPAAGTLGATIATASAGPLAHAFGAPRDNVLGLEAVTGDGRVIRAGGRVVKNVAGFDLVRLLTGAWGTLGVITEVTVRLRALPDIDETWRIAAPVEPDALHALLARVHDAAVAPLALELVSAPLARCLGVGDGPALLVRLGGNAEAVRAQREVCVAFGAAEPVPEDVWSTLAACEPVGAAVTRLSCAPSRLVGAWSAALDAVAGASGALVHASVGRGIVRCIVPADDAASVDRFLAAVARLDGTVIHERLPAGRWSSVPGALRHRLEHGVRRAFDPRRILNPGILGEDT